MNEPSADDTGVELPAVPQPQGLYRTVVVYDGLAFTAGMTPRVDGRLTVQGLIGREVGIEAAGEAARLAAENALAAIASAVGGLSRIAQCLRMTVYLACVDGFTEHSRIADHASAVLGQMPGQRGSVARSAVGVASLPGGAPVEIELTVALAP